MSQSHSPVNPLPPVVWALAVPVALIELIFMAAGHGFIGGAEGIGLRTESIQRFGFSGQIFDWMISNRYFPAEHLIRFVTYPFVHANFTHAAFVFVFILALGKMVGEVFPAWAVLAVFFGSAIMGALAYGVFLNDPAWLFGGYPAVYGLIGAFTFLIWTRLHATGGNPYRAFSLIGVLLGVQLLFGLLFGGGREWVADLAGFATGFVLSAAISPGGLARALSRIRQR